VDEHIVVVVRISRDKGACRTMKLHIATIRGDLRTAASIVSLYSLRTDAHEFSHARGPVVNEDIVGSVTVPEDEVAR